MKARKAFEISLLILSTVIIANAAVQIQTPAHIGLGNGAWITIFQPQNVENITIFNETGSPVSTVQIYINGSRIRYTTLVNKSLWNISYNNTSDILTYQGGNGTWGYLNISAQMKNATYNYSFKVDVTIIENQTSDSQRIVNFNYNTSTEHDFEILSRIISPPIIIPGKRAVITFTDTSCLNAGVICNSKVYVYKESGELIGKLSSEVDYIPINDAGNISIRLKPSTMSFLGNQAAMKEWMNKNYTGIFYSIILFGLAASGYFIIKKVISSK